MPRFHLLIFSLVAMGLSLFGNGCIEKTLLPAVIITVANVTPYDLVPTSTATAQLPSCQVNLTFETLVPTRLQSFSVSYASKLGQPIPVLRIEETPMEVRFTGGAAAVTFNPYTAKVVELYELTSSDISPIIATIRLTFRDANGNTVQRDATCRLFKL